MIANEPKIIGIFDRDSLLREMPGYGKIIDSLHYFRLRYDSTEILMFNELAAKRTDFFRDSANFSPAIKQLKLIEIVYMRENISGFANAAWADLENVTQQALRPLNDKITEASLKVRIGKKYPDRVMDKTELKYSFNIYDADKNVSVTKQMRKLPGLPEKK
jgi:hypothetical protein